MGPPPPGPPPAPNPAGQQHAPESMQAAQLLDQLNAILEQIAQSGQSIDPDAIAPGLQALGNNLALLSQNGQRQEGPEQGQPGERQEPSAGPPQMGRGMMPGFGG